MGKAFYKLVVYLVPWMLVSCVEMAEIDPYEKIVFVNSILTNDSVQTVNLSYSSHISESRYPKIDTADVRVSFVVDTNYFDGEKWVNIDSSGTCVFHKVEDGVWQAKFFPLQYAKYTLEVLVPGHDTITACTQYPVINNVKYYEYGWNDDQGVDDQNKKWFTAAFYTYQIDGNAPCTVWICGQDYDPVKGRYNIVDYLYTNHVYLDGFNLAGVGKDDIKEFAMIDDVSRKSLYNPYHYDPPFFNPNYIMTARRYVHYLAEWGMDYGELTSSTSEICDMASKWGMEDNKGYQFYDKYLRVEHPANQKEISYFRDNLEIVSSKAFVVCGNFKPYKYNQPHPLSHLIFEFVSDELDKYYMDLFLFNKRDFSDITLIWDRTEVYTNVKNGKGIFGAMSRCEMLWCISNAYRKNYLNNECQ